MRSQIESNASFLFQSLIERGQTTTEAAASIGLSADLLQKMLRKNRSISLATAAKLRQGFGADAIRIIAAPTAEE